MDLSSLETYGKDASHIHGMPGGYVQKRGSYDDQFYFKRWR